MKKLLPFLDKNFYPILAVIFILAVLLMPAAVLTNDYRVFVNWIVQMRDHGLASTYQLSTNNYFPMFNYLLYGMTLIFNSLSAIAANIHYLKIVLLACDFISVALCAWVLKKFHRPHYYALLILLNPAFFYNSWIWGQIEALYILFTVAAILAALYKHPNWSLVFYILAFYSKLQAIVFLPGLLLLLLPQYVKKPKLILQALFIFVVTQLIFLFPFIQAGQFTIMFKNVLTSVDMFPIVTANAYNFWVLVFGGQITIVKDATTLFIFSYKTWGIILFCLASALALWPLFWAWVKKPKNIPVLNQEYLFKVFLSTALIALIFFYFPTQMHERYLQPAILLFGMVFLLKPNVISGIAFGLISVTYFFQLERVMQFFQLPSLAYALMSSRIMSIAFTIVLILGFWMLYRKESPKV